MKSGSFDLSAAFVQDPNVFATVGFLHELVGHRTRSLSLTLSTSFAFSSSSPRFLTFEGIQGPVLSLHLFSP